jgi:hypothetical protein
MFSRGGSRPCSAFSQKAGLLEIGYEGMKAASQPEGGRDFEI